ncbi:sn-glycerol-3-phosphate ABC transporter ATP-binding protein UgpC [Tissierella sp. Yu-01]|uniref:ABC transporter ATP-binding protein n=1 Tax=Tissierella sp. Yu-01 TaxID=3035694 RepID=UPI00240E134D|nr:sn-glycerol-3-phosphate ABC transporter ATP-binding protein UgpC [Tissierella sp. Yu-01]WFA07959.1 sn-glycerol-3-phosphate ABC transporter ATP-binding protein UgpC [Tissierella sp. Yu-01]
MAEINLKNVSKIYDNGYEAVKSINLDMIDGEFMVLVGPSGCGKSTTLRMIAGLEEVSSGELYIGGELMNKIDPRDRNIAMVFQNYALYPHMSVYDNMAFGLKLQKLDKKEIDKRINDAAKTLDIDTQLNKKPKALSGGQRQRVALGRAIVRHPKVFLMDEPLSNLDAKLRVQMRAELIRLHEELRTTFVYVTHDQTEAMTMGSRICVMKDGVIKQVATPEEIYNKPDNLFVAGFIGSPQMNFYKGVIVEEEGIYYLLGSNGDYGEFKFLIEEVNNEVLRPHANKRVIFGVRPEHIKFTEEDGMKAKVMVTELLGDEVHVHIHVQGQIHTIKTKSPTNIKSGDVVKIIPNENKIHLFDPETENALL